MDDFSKFIEDCITKEIDNRVNAAVDNAARKAPKILKRLTKEPKYPSASGNGRDYDIIDTGKFAESMIADVTSSSGNSRTVSIGNTQPYTDIIEDGQSAGIYPNADKITGWVGRKFGYSFKQDSLQGLKSLANSGDQEAKQQLFHVYNISRKIFERGLEGRNFFELNAENMLDILENELFNEFT